MIDRYILAIQQIITHLRYSFWSVAIFWTASEALTPWSQQQKVAEATSKPLSLSNSSQKSSFFAVLMYALYGHPRYFKFKRKYQQYGPCSQTILLFFMTMSYIISPSKIIFKEFTRDIITKSCDHPRPPTTTHDQP